jgi:hypothetical protein
MKLNDEPTDPTTGYHVDAISRMKKDSTSRRYAAELLCKLNHRVFVKRLNRKLQGCENLSCDDLSNRAHAVLRTLPEKDVFTDAFNASTRYAAMKLERTTGAKTSARCVDDLLASVRATEINLQSVTKMEISLYLQKNLGLLHGKNACSILERYFKTRPCTGMYVWSWVSSPGSLMGPGAKCGSNIFL